MRWHTSVMVLWALGYVTLSTGILQRPESYIDDIPPNQNNVVTCGHSGNRDKVSFYCVPDVVNSKYFPRINDLSGKRRERWVAAIKMDDLTPSVLRNQRVFTVHIITEDLNLSNLQSYDEEVLDKIGNILTKLLIVPWPKGVSPLVYVENSPEQEDEELVENPQIEGAVHPAPLKRTRYYRKYPWKRQNSRYEPGNRFLCTPSKDDVYRLLVALHEARQGNRERVVNFCNRKRPAHAIFTNIRFLGK